MTNNNPINPKTNKPYKKGYWDMIGRKSNGKIFFIVHRDLFIQLVEERELKICKMYWEDDVFQSEIGRTIGFSSEWIRRLLEKSRDAVEKHLSNM